MYPLKAAWQSLLPITLLSSVGLEVCVLVALEAVLSELCSFELDLPLLEEVLDERDGSDRGRRRR